MSGWTDDLLARRNAEVFGGRSGEVLPKPIAKGVPRDPAGNKTEQRYGVYLSLLQKAGEILQFGFEEITIKLGKDCRYTVDYWVMTADYSLEMHEVKGRNHQSYYARDDAKVKVRVAAAKFPFRFFVVFEQENGEWEKVPF